MQTILTDTNTWWPPTEWMGIIVQHHDPQRQYVVTAISHYKEWPPFPSCQQEYIILVIEPEPHHSPGQPQPPEVPTVVKVSRTIQGAACLARLGMYGNAVDTVSVLGPVTTINIPHNSKCIHHLTWPAKQAPSLVVISRHIAVIHHALLPDYYCLLKTSCYSFARAVIDCIYIIHGGTHWQTAERDRPGFLTPGSHLLWIIPVGMTRTQFVVKCVAIAYECYRAPVTDGEVSCLLFASLVTDV